MSSLEKKLISADAKVHDTSYVTPYNERIKNHRMLLERVVLIINKTYENFVKATKQPNKKRMCLRHKANTIPYENHDFWTLIDECNIIYGRDFFNYLDHVEYENAGSLEMIFAFLNMRWYDSIDYRVIKTEFKDVFNVVGQ